MTLTERLRQNAESGDCDRATSEDMALAADAIDALLALVRRTRDMLDADYCEIGGELLRDAQAALDAFGADLLNGGSPRRRGP